MLLPYAPTAPPPPPPPPPPFPPPPPAGILTPVRQKQEKDKKEKEKRKEKRQCTPITVRQKQGVVKRGKNENAEFKCIPDMDTYTVICPYKGLGIHIRVQGYI